MLVQSKEIERDEDRTNRGDIGNSENRGKRRLIGLRLYVLELFADGRT